MMSLLSKGRIVNRRIPLLSKQFEEVIPSISIPSCYDARSFSSEPPSDPSDIPKPDFSKLRRFEDANPERISGINVNPASIGTSILPGNLVYKKYKFSGNTRKIPLELEHGYFWMLTDLKKTEGKPILPNETLIPDEDAQTFPTLTGLKTLNQEEVDLPFCLVDVDKKNTDPFCTLVAISFRDNGYQRIPSWLEPFEKAFAGQSRVRTIKVSISERWSLLPFKGALSSLMRRNTPPEEHDNTLLYFGTDVDEFRDVLRMHNIMTNFVFLVDDMGRIRFASSGEATEEEIALVTKFADELTRVPKRRGGRKKSKKSRK